jgi:hypothetical protein
MMSTAAEKERESEIEPGRILHRESVYFEVKVAIELKERTRQGQQCNKLRTEPKVIPVLRFRSYNQPARALFACWRKQKLHSPNFNCEFEFAVGSSFLLSPARNKSSI